MASALEQLSIFLKENSSRPFSGKYFLPSLWAEPENPGPSRVREVNPFTFYADRVADILTLPDETPQRGTSKGEWSKNAVVYNIFVRHTTAWDHDGSGGLDTEPLPDGFMETGTFLKSIAILPYIKSLGFNTIHLLPVTSIGSDGNKGSLGSPYAIRNAYKLDERLSEPWLGMNVETQFAAFVEAAHRFGMRVITEFVFRTAAKDADWVIEHPEWFYWIDAAVPDRESGASDEKSYGNPLFTKDELAVIKKQFAKADPKNLPPPHREFLAMFTEPPVSVANESGRLIGTTKDGKRTRIPGAFADWPPDDLQPPWNDVTYLKMYDDPNFNYIAYNTIRFYDARLLGDSQANKSLWDAILNIIPYFQKTFGIDGVMIDMGHALPPQLKAEMVRIARENDADFAFWEENFALTKKSHDDGYNVSVGYLWSDIHLPKKVHEFCAMLSTKGSPIPFFAMPENHNTPRAAMRDGGIVFSRLTALIDAFMPGLFFVHQGYELGERLPVNTGLGFTPEQLAELPSHTLPLFSESQLCWDNPDEMSGWVRRLLALRAEWLDIVTNPHAKCFIPGICASEEILCYVRTNLERTKALAVVVNMNCVNELRATVEIPLASESITDVLTGRSWKKAKGSFAFDFAPGEGFVFELKK